jgi:hypothetical protein
MNEKYNGWTNYATWRVGLEIINDMRLDDFGVEYHFPTDKSRSYGGEHDGEDHDMIDTSDLADAMRDYVQDHIEETSEGVAKDYAFAFLSDVNWYELAEHMIEEEKEASE